MTKKTDIEKTLDTIESRIKGVTKLARQLTPGNVSHLSGNLFVY